MAPEDEYTCDSPGEEKPHEDIEGGPLFYAYARRTDSSWASRYLLTFASAAVANEWWSLVQREYHGAGVRTSPQLFSFEGDKLPQKIANDKKFDHLTTKWFYSQIGDSDGTGGRLQDVIPVQDWDGTVLGGGSGGSASGLGEAFQAALQTMQSLMEGNFSQLKTLVDIQSENNERFARLEKFVEDSATQIKTLSQGQSASQEQMKEMLKQNREQLKYIADERTSSVEKLQEALIQIAQASADMAKELKRQRQQKKGQASTVGTKNGAECTHNVHPPPRKIDKPIVGYDYGQKSTNDVKGKAAAKGANA